MLKKETRGVAQQIFRPLLYDETIYNEISNFRLPFSIFKRSATYKEVRDYLQEEQIINTIEFQPTRNDIFPNIIPKLR